jgi:hypothetical protein
LKLITKIQIKRRIIMWKKTLILSLSLAMLFVISAPISSVNAGDKSVPVNWQIAGSIANNVQVLINVSTDPQNPDFRTIPHFLISLSAKGSPGPAEITLMGYGSVVFPPISCEEGELEIKTAYSDMVARFRDLSLLFASYDDANPGFLCINPAEGLSRFENHLVITGGTGRFAGATGTLTGTGEGYYFASGGALAGEVGEITGKIDLP